jgi:hypothetical protein
VDITGNNQRRVEFNEVRLANEDLLALFNEHLNLLFSEVDRLYSKVRSICSNVLPDLEEGVDDIVQLILVNSATRGST